MPAIYLSKGMQCIRLEEEAMHVRADFKSSFKISFRKKNMSIDSDRIIILDTTLRDGEQSPGASMSLEEKLVIADTLETMGVDVIEAGFPIASEGNFEATREVARQCQKSVVCGFARAAQGDIQRCFDAVKFAPRHRIHTFISTSDLHMKYKLQMTPDEVVAKIDYSIRFARSLTNDVEWSAEDATRTDFDFLCRCVEAAIKAGASTINIPDTVGYTMPAEYFSMIEMLKNKVPNIDQAILSTHCHNDLGLAVANSISAIRAGARQVEVTVNGIGERAGNAALEEIVMALKARNDVLPFATNIQTKLISKVSRQVSKVTGIPVQNHKAIVGKNAFLTQNGILDQDRVYNVLNPQAIGLKAQTVKQDFPSVFHF